MIKLKTLKDLEDIRDDYSEPSVWSSELKEEAIKWIKQLEHYKSLIEPNMTDVMIECIEEEHDREQALTEWIKMFFNISNKDLK